METTTGSLVIVNPHTEDRKVFWNGQEVTVAGFVIQNDATTKRVVLQINEDPTVSEMRNAGITVKRER